MRSSWGGHFARSGRLIALAVPLVILIQLLSTSGVAGSVDITSTPIPSGMRGAVSQLQADAQRTWDIRWDASTPVPRVLAGGRTAGVSGDPVGAALTFVRQHGDLFGLADAPASVAVDLTSLRRKRLLDRQVVTLQHTVGGLPIIDARVSVLVGDDGTVHHVSSSAVQLTQVPALTPSLSATDAVVIAHRAIDEALPCREDQLPRLAVFSSDSPRLVYEVVLSVNRSRWEPWRVLVDAESGDAVRQVRLVQEATGVGRVFDPNPMVSLASVTLRDENDAVSAVPSAAYRVVPLENLNEPSGGWYTLGGDYVTLVNKSIPTNFAPVSTDGRFLYWRDHDAFEEVMVYYTIDRNQTYIQSLGFSDINNRAIDVDAHANFGMDNSFYTGSPVGAGYIEFGDGGVDDAEDADIILHEYGHAIQDNSNPGVFFGVADNGYGNETGAMAEGFCDYWAAAAAYDSSVAHTFPPEFFGEWNAAGLAGGPALYLRLVNSTKTYPGGMIGQVHADGEIWSGLLWELFDAMGRETVDKIVLYSHFLLPANPDFADGAQALIDADALLYPVDLGPGSPSVGEHHNIICGIASLRGILTCSPICDCSEQGNAHDDAYYNLLDVIEIANEAFFNSSNSPKDPLCPHVNRSDYNCDDFIDASDLSLAVDYVFMNGKPPCDPCE